MTPYRFRLVSAGILFALLAFAILAFGAVELWALTIFEVGVFLLAAIWLVRFALGKLPLVWNPFYLPLGALAVWAGAQHFFGLSVYSHRTAIEALKWLALWVMFIMAAHIFTDGSIREAFTLALVLMSGALCAFGLVQHFSSPGVMYWTVPVLGGRMFGPFVNANHFATLMELTYPAALLLVLRRTEQRLIYAAVCTLILAAIVVSASRAGMVLVALQTLVVLGSRAVVARRSRRSVGKQLGLAAAALAAIALIAVSIARNEALLERFREEQPYRIRWNVVQATWKLFLERPWTGFGAGTFDQVYPSAAIMDLDLFWPHAHNDPVQFAMEWGVAGLVALGWILCLLLRRLWPLEIWLRIVLPVMTVLAHSWLDFPLQIPALTAAWLLTLAMLDPSARQAVAQEAGRSA